MSDCFGAFFRGKRVLVTGHTGFKGAWLSHWLQDLGADVVGYSIAVPEGLSLFALSGLDAQIDHQLGDINDLAMLEATLASARPQVIFHLAAQSLVSGSYVDPLGTLRTNALGTANLLEAIRSRPWPELRAVVLVTTDKVYGDGHGDRPLQESDALGSADPYSTSKAMAELAIATYVRLLASRPETQSVRIAAVRAGNIFGGADWARHRLIPDCVGAILEARPIHLRCPQAVRPWQYVLEPLAGYLHLAARLTEDSRIPSGEGWNFGPSAREELTAEQIARHLLTFAPPVARPEIVVEPVGWKETAVLRLDSAKARQGLGWATVLSVEEGLLRTLEFYRAIQRAGSSEDIGRLVRDEIRDYTRLALARGQPWSNSETVCLS